MWKIAKKQLNLIKKCFYYMLNKLETRIIKMSIESWEYRLNGGTYWWEEDVYTKDYILSQIEYFKKQLLKYESN